MEKIAWGKKVSTEFKAKVIALSVKLRCDPSHLMSAMAFETGESFSPKIQNSVSKAYNSCLKPPRAWAPRLMN
jgi:hypothetical protein